MRVPHPDSTVDLPPVSHNPPTFDQQAAALQARESRECDGPSPWKLTAGGARQIEKVKYSHQAMIDVIITNPGCSQRQLAEYFGYTESWVSTILASDAFQVMLSQRREELVDPILLITVKERMQALAHKSLEKLMQEMEKPMVDPELALKAAALGAKCIGLGEGRVMGPLQMVVSPDERLERLAGKLDGLLKLKRMEVEDVKVIESSRD